MKRLYIQILNFHKTVILVTILLTSFFAYGLTRLELRTDGAAIYPMDNEIVEQTEYDRDLFLDPQQIILLLSSKSDSLPLASPLGFTFIKSVHNAMKILPGVYSDGVSSLASIPNIRSNSEEMVISTYLEEIPTDSISFKKLLSMVKEAPLTEGLFLSSNGLFASVYIPLVDGVVRNEVISTIESWLENQNDSIYDMRITGPVVAETTLGDIVFRDLTVLIPVMVAIVALMLLATLRTLGGLLIPLIEALAVLIWTLGLMGWLGVPVTLVTTILPVILMTMAITDEIHVLQRFQKYLYNKNVSKQSAVDEKYQKESAIVESLKDVGRPIVATSITTAIGFLSFLTASMVPMRHFGVFTAFGIVIAMVLSFTFIPCLMVNLPKSWFNDKRNKKQIDKESKLNWLEKFSTENNSKALLIGIIIIVIITPGIYWLDVQDSWIENFDKSSALVSAEKDFNENFWGSYRLDVIFERDEGFFYTKNGISLIEEFTKNVKEGPFVGGVTSYQDIYREVALGLGETEHLSDLSDEKIQDISTVADMASDPRQLLQLIGSNGISAKATIFVNRPNYQKSERLTEFVENVCNDLNSKYNSLSHISGDIPVALEVVQSIVINQMRSISWTILGIGILLLLTFPRGLAALIVMVPVASTAILVLAAMGYAGIPLGIATSMFASLTIGVGIDFALHFYHNYKHEREDGNDHNQAISKTFENTGQAIRWNALILLLGFLVLTFSVLKPDRDLGILLAAAIVTCYIMTLLTLPRLLKFLSMSVLLIIVSSNTIVIGSEIKSDNQSARTYVHKIEKNFRQNARLTKIEFETSYTKRVRSSLSRTMWGVINGEPENTKMLYVVTAPQRMEGTALLFADNANIDMPDSTWLYLSAIKRVRLLDIRSARAMVPGTALTYEDSRGFIPVDKYTFKFVREDMKIDSNFVMIKAVPRTDSIAAGVGYSSMLIQIDTIRNIITRIDFNDPEGNGFKFYLLNDAIKINDFWYPSGASVHNTQSGIFSEAKYEYWLIETMLDKDFFSPDVHNNQFYDRLKNIALENELILSPQDSVK